MSAIDPVVTSVKFRVFVELEGYKRATHAVIIDHGLAYFSASINGIR